MPRWLTGKITYHLFYERASRTTNFKPHIRIGRMAYSRRNTVTFMTTQHSIWTYFADGQWERVFAVDLPSAIRQSSYGTNGGVVLYLLPAIRVTADRYGSPACLIGCPLSYNLHSCVNLQLEKNVSQVLLESVQFWEIKTSSYTVVDHAYF